MALLTNPQEPESADQLSGALGPYRFSNMTNARAALTNLLKTEAELAFTTTVVDDKLRTIEQQDELSAADILLLEEVARGERMQNERGNPETKLYAARAIAQLDRVASEIDSAWKAETEDLLVRMKQTEKTRSDSTAEERINSSLRTLPLIEGFVDKDDEWNKEWKFEGTDHGYEQHNKPWRMFVLEHLQQEGKLGKTVVDLGCGRDPDTAFLAANGLSVIHADKYGAPQIEGCTGVLCDIGESWKTIDEALKAREIPGQADTFYICNVLNYVSADHVLKEARKRLPKGGRVVIFNQPLLGPSELFSVCGAHDNFRLLEQLSKNGFSVENIQSLPIAQSSNFLRISKIGIIAVADGDNPPESDEKDDQDWLP